MSRGARLLFVAVLFTCAASAACEGLGGGSKWVQQPLVEEEQGPPQDLPSGAFEGSPAKPAAHPGSRVIGATTPRASGANPESADRTGGGGRSLGTFRNTYYDFPREADHSGPTIALMSATCQPIAQVPRTFYEAVCVQGSGSLKRGGTVSFAKRDCACAEICPRTGQRICFDALDPVGFPWGRGAAGTPITPMRTLAADTTVLPLGTVVYIPELDGAPRGESGEPFDGCFVVEDRGVRVKGQHVDIFTGHPANTAILNERVPSNQGVTVIVDAPRCTHLAAR
jgi:3D (Asp-Asp-Asp) domain-containing protein